MKTTSTNDKWHLRQNLWSHAEGSWWQKQVTEENVINLQIGSRHEEQKKTIELSLSLFFIIYLLIYLVSLSWDLYIASHSAYTWTGKRQAPEPGAGRMTFLQNVTSDHVTSDLILLTFHRKLLIISGDVTVFSQIHCSFSLRRRDSLSPAFHKGGCRGARGHDPKMCVCATMLLPVKLDGPLIWSIACVKLKLQAFVFESYGSLCLYVISVSAVPLT